MPLPTTFAGVSSRGEGGFLGSYGPPPIGGPYYASVIQQTSGAVVPEARLTSIKVDNVGNVYEFGSTADLTAGLLDFSLYVCKRNSSGVPIFLTPIFNNNYGQNNTSIYPTLSNIGYDSTGNTYICFYDGSASETIIMKLSITGGQLWAKRLQNVQSRGFVVDLNGNMYVNCVFSSNVLQSLVVKIDTNANLIAKQGLNWNLSGQILGLFADKPNGIIMDSSNNIYIAGSLYTDNNNYIKGYVKLNNSLNIISAVSWGGNLSDVHGIVVDNSGTVTTLQCSTTLFTLNAMPSGSTALNLRNFSPLNEANTVQDNFASLSLNPITQTLVVGLCLSTSSSSQGNLIKFDSSNNVSSTYVVYGYTSIKGLYNAYNSVNCTTFDASGNFYYGGAVNNSSHGSYTAFKSTSTQQFELSYIIKDTNNFGISHNMNGSVTVNTVPMNTSPLTGETFSLSSASGTLSSANLGNSGLDYTNIGDVNTTSFGYSSGGGYLSEARAII